MPPLPQRARRVLRRLRPGRQDSPGRGASGRGHAAGATVPRASTDGLATELERATAERRHDDAMALVERELPALLSSRPEDPSVLRQMQRSAAAAGAASTQLRVLRRRLELSPTSPSLQQQLTRLEGRRRETDAAWSPTVDPAVLAHLRSSRPTADGSPRAATVRVVHVVKVGLPQQQSGYTMRTMYTLAGQRAVGLDPVVVTALDFPVTEGVPLDESPAEDVVDGTRYVHLLRPAIPEDEPWDAYLDAWAGALAPVVAREDPALIHVHSGHRGYETALVALAVGRALGIPVVYEVRGFFEALWTGDLAQAERSEVYERRYAQEARCMREADAVVTLSDSMRDDIVARGVDPRSVHVVPNGIDPARFTRLDPAERAGAADLTRPEGSTVDAPFVVGYVSNLDHHREGIEVLIDAVAELHRRGVPVRALLIGDGRRRAELEAHTAAAGAEDLVTFTGKVPHAQIRSHYAALDVFVVPRVDERAARLVTPLKPYEAMALGVPLVVSDLPALREVVGGGRRGSLFAAGDAGSLADVLEALYRDPARRVELAARAREWVVTERDWAQNGRRYAEIYDEVLAGP